MTQDDGINDIKRIHTGEVELGVTDALQRHITRKVVPAKPVSQRRLDFEHKRPRILRECMAEATGVFFYVLPGVAAVTAFTLATYGEAAKEVGVPSFGGLMQIALSFGFGIAFAIITCAPTSGGHFNPAVTICLTIWQGFPIRKAPLYILSQIFGAFMAGMVIMGCFWPELSAVKALNIEQHGTAVFNGGAASVLCTFPNPNQTNQGFLFFQEFMVDAFIGIVIWSCLDPANPFVTPASVPWTIGLCYSAMIMGFAGNSISTNLARDLGTRIVAAIFFGKEAFTFDNGYSWISILVNVPATIFATGYYELVLRDSLKKIHTGHAAHEDGEAGLVRHLTKIENSERGVMLATERSGKQSDEMTV